METGNRRSGVAGADRRGRPRGLHDDDDGGNPGVADMGLGWYPSIALASPILIPAGDADQRHWSVAGGLGATGVGNHADRRPADPLDHELCPGRHRPARRHESEDAGAVVVCRPVAGPVAFEHLDGRVEVEIIVPDVGLERRYHWGDDDPSTLMTACPEPADFHLGADQPPEPSTKAPRLVDVSCDHQHPGIVVVGGRPGDQVDQIRLAADGDLPEPLAADYFQEPRS